jgi:hypothetical protein
MLQRLKNELLKNYIFALIFYSIEFYTNRSVTEDHKGRTIIRFIRGLSVAGLIGHFSD